MELIFSYPFETILSLLSSSFSLITAIFIISFTIRLLQLGSISYDFFILLGIQLLLLIFSFFLSLNSFKVLNLSTNVIFSFFLLLVGIISIYNLLIAFNIKWSIDKILVIVPFISAIAVILNLSNGFYFITYTLSIIATIYLTIQTFYAKSSVKTILNSLACFVLIISSFLVVFIKTNLVTLAIIVITLSFYALFLIFWEFRENYLSINFTKNKVLEEILEINSNLISFSSLVGKINIYRNQNQKLSFSLDSNVRKLYNYFRYVGGIVSSSKDKIGEIKFLFERLIYNLNDMKNNIDSFIFATNSIGENFEEFNTTISISINKINERSEVFKSLSENITNFLVEIDKIKTFLKNAIEFSSIISNHISSIINGITFIEQVSIEGEISSKNLNFYVITDSFRQIKNDSYREIQNLSNLKNKIGEAINKYVSLIDELDNIRKSTYELLSLSDSVYNISSSMAGELEKLSFKLESYNITDMINENKRNINSIFEDISNTKDEILEEFLLINSVLDIVNIVNNKILELVEVVRSVDNITQSILTHLDIVEETLVEIKKEIDLILV